MEKFYVVSNQILPALEKAGDLLFTTNLTIVDVLLILKCLQPALATWKAGNAAQLCLETKSPYPWAVISTAKRPGTPRFSMTPSLFLDTEVVDAYNSSQTAKPNFDAHHLSVSDI
jgi:hypothetical protein